MKSCEQDKSGYDGDYDGGYDGGYDGAGMRAHTHQLATSAFTESLLATRSTFVAKPGAVFSYHDTELGGLGGGGRGQSAGLRMVVVTCGCCSTVSQRIPHSLSFWTEMRTFLPSCSSITCGLR